MAYSPGNTSSGTFVALFGDYHSYGLGSSGIVMRSETSSFAIPSFRLGTIPRVPV